MYDISDSAIHLCLAFIQKMYSCKGECESHLKLKCFLVEFLRGPNKQDHVPLPLSFRGLRNEATE